MPRRDHPSDCGLQLIELLAEAALAEAEGLNQAPGIGSWPRRLPRAMLDAAAWYATIKYPGRAVQPERRGETALPDGPAIKGRNTPARLPPRFPAPGKCTSHLGFGLVEPSATDMSRWIQRRVMPRRARQIAAYLIEQKQHFFPGIVVGVYLGEPAWYDINIGEHPTLGDPGIDPKLRDTLASWS